MPMKRSGNNKMMWVMDVYVVLTYTNHYPVEYRVAADTKKVVAVIDETKPDHEECRVTRIFSDKGSAEKYQKRLVKRGHSTALIKRKLYEKW